MIDRPEFLIAGQGLAGSLLARALLQRGRRAVAIDPGHENAASMVAAGALNPVTGKRFVKTWLVDELMPYAKSEYERLERELRASFFESKTIIRVCQSEEERERWRKRRSDAAYDPWMGRELEPGALGEPFIDTLGSFEIVGAGHLEIPVFLKRMRAWLKEQGALIEARADPEALRVGPSCVEWNGVSADRVIFCDGWQGARNPWLSWLPFNLAKGEILFVRLGLAGAGRIVHKDKWALPTPDGVCRIGSTWSHEKLDCAPSAQGRRALLEGLQRMARIDPPHVEAHLAGVRPTTRDRLPFMGAHPGEPRVCVFNGFGSKGALAIPYLASRFADWLCETGGFPPEADIKRLVEKFYEKSRPDSRSAE